MSTEPRRQDHPDTGICDGCGNAFELDQLTFIAGAFSACQTCLRTPAMSKEMLAEIISAFLECLAALNERVPGPRAQGCSLEYWDDVLKRAKQTLSDGLMLPYAKMEMEAQLQSLTRELTEERARHEELKHQVERVDMLPLLAERDALVAFAERHGWLTRDGVYVSDTDPVFYCTCTQSPSTPRHMRLPFDPWFVESTAEEVNPDLWKYQFSTREAAEAHARKKWETLP